MCFPPLSHPLFIICVFSPLSSSTCCHVVPCCGMFLCVPHYCLLLVSSFLVSSFKIKLPSLVNPFVFESCIWVQLLTASQLDLGTPSLPNKNQHLHGYQFLHFLALFFSLTFIILDLFIRNFCVICDIYQVEVLNQINLFLNHMNMYWHLYGLGLGIIFILKPFKEPLAHSEQHFIVIAGL